MIGRHYHFYVNEDSINATEHTQWNPKIKADNKKPIDKTNAFSETLRSTITSFIKDGYTERQIVDELIRIDVKTSRWHEFSAHHIAACYEKTRFVKVAQYIIQ